MQEIQSEAPLSAPTASGLPLSKEGVKPPPEEIKAAPPISEISPKSPTITVLEAKLLRSEKVLFEKDIKRFLFPFKTFIKQSLNINRL